MTRLTGIMSMSLDGFVADRTGNAGDVMGWYMNSGDTEVVTGGPAAEWAAKLARACRCSQEVREFGYDPES